MMQMIWDIVTEKVKVPEGFQGAIGQTVSLTGPQGFFSRTFDPQLNFWLERITARWPTQTASNNFPAITLMRDTGQRSIFGILPLDVRTIANPGELPASNPKGLRYHGQPLGILYEAGATISATISGYTPSDPASMHIVMIGRFIRRQEGAW